MFLLKVVYDFQLPLAAAPRIGSAKHKLWRRPQNFDMRLLVARPRTCFPVLLAKLFTPRN
jgi:hypothetical protein